MPLGGDIERWLNSGRNHDVDVPLRHVSRSGPIPADRVTAAVTVSIVNFNHARYLPACLEALRAQSAPPQRIIVVDNASSDGSRELLAGLDGDVEIILNDTNRGYAGGHNQAFRLAGTEYVLALNCDVVLDPDFLREISGALDRAPAAGSGCGRLYRGVDGDGITLDSTGLFPDRFRRFWDRDHDDPAEGWRTAPSTVFGPSGSAALYRKAMLEDVASEGQYFDEDFFAYCEDADLAWRAQSFGWSSLYVPTATGGHAHADLSRARSSQRDGDANFRQLLLIRNRHLCFLKNDAALELLRDLPWLLVYDVALQAYLLVKKPRLAVRWPVAVLRALPKTLAKRSRTFRRQRRRVRLAEWFDRQREREAAG